MKKNLLLFLFLFAGLSLAVGQIDTVTSPFRAGGNAFDWGMGTYQLGATVITKAEYQTTNCDSAVVTWLDLDASWATVKAWPNIVDGGSSGNPIDGVINDTIMLPEDYPLSVDAEGHFLLLQVRAYYSDGTDAYSNGSFKSVAAFTDSIKIDTIYGFADMEQLGDVNLGDTISFKGSYGIDDIEMVEVNLMHLNSSWGTVKEAPMNVYNPGAGVGLKTGHMLVDYMVPEDFSTVDDLAEGDFIVLRVFAKYGDGSNIFFFSWLNVLDPNVSVEQKGYDSFVMYPNPAGDMLNFKGLEAGLHQISIYSITGAVVMNTELDGMNSLSVADLAPGIYFLDIQGSEGRTLQKFSKQ